MRKTARLKIEYVYLIDENKSLSQMLDYCEKELKNDSIALVEKDNQLLIKDQQIKNRQQMYVTMESKYMLADEQVKKERRQKYIYLSTTVGLLILLTISMFN